MATPPAPAAAAACYRPHNLERHHATHLLREVFDDPNAHSGGGPDFADDQKEGGICIGGREGVGLLTSSGVDRDTLRPIWSAADPGGVGTLTRRSQLHALLRLVAMSQAHLLPPIGGVDDPTPVLLESLAKFHHLDISLPTFGACPTPTTAFLISTYAVQSQTSAGDAAAMGASSGQAFSMATDAEFQRRAWLEAQNRTAHGGGGVVGGMGMGGSGMGAAAAGGTGGYGGGVADAGMGMGGPGGAGGGAAVNGAGARGLSIQDAFADMPGAEDKVLPSDDFGDFAEADEGKAGAAPPVAAQEASPLVQQVDPSMPTMEAQQHQIVSGDTQQMQLQTQTQQPQMMQGMPPSMPADIGNIMQTMPDAPVPPLGGPLMPPPVAVSEDEGFGDFGEAAPDSSAPPHGSAPVGVSDAFAAMGPPTEAPPAAPTAPTATVGDDEGDAGFGDFGEAPSISTQPPEAVALAGASDAFGGMPGEAPPPSAPAVDLAAGGASADDDDFGDFADAPATDAPPALSFAPDAFGDLGTTPSSPPSKHAPPVKLPPAHPADLSGAAFGGFGVAPPSVPAADLSAFGAGVASSVGGGGGLASVDDAFASMGVPLEDAPLPSLTAPEDGEEEEEEEFGDFGDGGDAPTDEDGGAPGGGENDDGFGAFGEADGGAANDGGGVGDVAESGAPADAARAVDDVEDGFGAFGKADGGGDDEDEDFGAFGKAKGGAPAEAAAATAAVGDDGDGLRTFGEADGEAPATGEDDAFGDFDGDGFDAPAESPPVAPVADLIEDGGVPKANGEANVVEADGGFGAFEDADAGAGGLPSPERIAADFAAADDAPAAGAGAPESPPSPESGDGAGDDDAGGFSLPSPDKMAELAAPHIGGASAPPLSNGDDDDCPESEEPDEEAVEEEEVGGLSLPSPDKMMGVADVTVGDLPEAPVLDTSEVDADADGAIGSLELPSPDDVAGDEAAPDVDDSPPASEESAEGGTSADDDDAAETSSGLSSSIMGPGSMPLMAPPLPPALGGFGDAAADDPLGAFDALVEADLTKSGIIPVALPSLEAFAAPIEPEPEPTAAAEDEDDDFGDFGGFEGTSDSNDNDSSGAGADVDGESSGYVGNPPSDMEGEAVRLASRGMGAEADASYVGPPPSDMGGEEVGGADASFGEFGDFGGGSSSSSPPAEAEAAGPYSSAPAGTSDDFGDFGAFSGGGGGGGGGDAAADETPGDVEPPATEAAAAAEASDDFGDFSAFAGDGEAPSEGAPGASPAEAVVPAVPEMAAETSDDFGDFSAFAGDGEAAPAEEAAEAAPTVAEAAVAAETSDDFGDFSAFPGDDGDAAPTKAEPPAPEAAADTGDDDDFGGFAAFSSSPAANAAHPPLPGAGPPLVAEDVPNGFAADFGAPPAAAEPPEADDDFGGFRTQFSEPAVETIATTDVPPDAEAEETPSSAAAPAADFDADFGDFGTFEQPPQEEQAGLAPEPAAPAADFDADFGSFEDAPSPPSPAAPAPTREDSDVNADGDDAEETFPTPGEKAGVLLASYREELAALPALPKQLLAKKHDATNKSGGRFRRKKAREVSYVACFDKGVGAGDEAGGGGGGWLPIAEQIQIDPDGANARLQRARRCLSLHRLLSSNTHKKHGEHFHRILAIAQDELANSHALLEKVSNGPYSREERAALADSDEMRTFAAGLGEYVRVARSVVATVGDLLCVEEGTDFAAALAAGGEGEGDLSAWGNLELLRGGLAAEESWAGIQGAMSRISLAVPPPSVETVAEMRRGSAASKAEDGNYCTLTLRPLRRERGDTRATVTWDGRPYMACAANFWSHKVSTTSPAIF